MTKPYTKQELQELSKQSERLATKAINGLRKYREAIGVLDPEEVERLRVEAESLFEAVQTYHFQVLNNGHK
ncbi:hypothetical protein [Pseudomonas sp. Irchel 3E13]|uniref:hypothetical protein n=1 Tax=Pseudomonas sp. Irchel 3E13 TaxID=2008975 RepID=UPI000BA45847|nr:hypothetical protein [Pseudomonas sp. Irchel 3E13]